jgi:fermentation-respiration switch protein FrsA (DUF1100 family)
MYLQQPRMVFFPSRAQAGTPADWGLRYEDLRFDTDDGVSLHGWYIPAAGARQVVLFLHGNAGNISHRGESLEIFHRLGVNVLIFDYRGYGRSGGAPSEAGLYRDAGAAWRYLTEIRGVDPADILIFGRSLGGAVAARLASRVPAGGVILESTFSSARDLAHSVFPLLGRLVVLRYDFDSVRALAGVRSPVLVLHSRDDEIVPFALGRRLYQSAPEPKRFVELRGDHNSGFIVSRPDYDRALQAWLLSLRAHPGGRRSREPSATP